MSDEKVNNYIKDQCFPLSELKHKVSESLYPFNNIKQGSAQVVKKEKTRLELTLITKEKKEKKISLLCAVQYPKKEEEGGKPDIFINARSFDNYIKNIASERKLQGLVSDELEEVERLPDSYLF